MCCFPLCLLLAHFHLLISSPWRNPIAPPLLNPLRHPRLPGRYSAVNLANLLRSNSEGDKAGPNLKCGLGALIRVERLEPSKSRTSIRNWRLTLDRTISEYSFQNES